MALGISHGTLGTVREVSRLVEHPSEVLTLARQIFNSLQVDCF